MTREQLKAVADLAAASIKLAHAAEARAKKAPKPVAPELVEKAARALVTTGFVPEDLKKAAADKLASAEGALELVESVAVKAAEEFARLAGREPNARLAAGEALPAADPVKQAEAETAKSTDDFCRRMSAFARR